VSVYKLRPLGPPPCHLHPGRNVHECFPAHHPEAYRLPLVTP
jgi:hypothetical protein